MMGLALNQLLKGRIHATVIWAMIPLALLNSRTVFGCVAPDGQYNPNCSCLAVQDVNDSASQHATKHCCGCSCCASGNCTCACCTTKAVGTSPTCCQNKLVSGSPAARAGDRYRVEL